MPRACREAHLADPSLTSGMHWIDPDGQFVSDDPIYVYCDMDSGIRRYNNLKDKPNLENLSLIHWQFLQA